MQRVYKENEGGKVSKIIVTIPCLSFKDPRLDLQWAPLRLLPVAYRCSSFPVLQLPIILCCPCWSSNYCSLVQSTM